MKNRISNHDYCSKSGVSPVKRNILYAIAAIPAGYLPLAYVLAICYAATTWVAGMDHGVTAGSVAWWACGIAIYATLVQWPLYLLWVPVSKELSVKLRIVWILIIIIGNMLTMPLFLWLKYTRNTRDALLNVLRPGIRQYLER